MKNPYATAQSKLSNLAHSLQESPINDESNHRHLRSLVNTLQEFMNRAGVLQAKAAVSKSAQASSSLATPANLHGVFTEDDIRRGDLPRDAFELIHDLAYDHGGRDRTQYRLKAQEILKRDKYV